MHWIACRYCVLWRVCSLSIKLRRLSKSFSVRRWKATTALEPVFICMVTPSEFIHRLKSWSHLVQHNKQYHLKVLLSSFHSIGYLRILNSSTDSKVNTTLHSIINNTAGKFCSAAFIWMVTPQDFIHRQVICYFVNRTNIIWIWPKFNCP